MKPREDAPRVLAAGLDTLVLAIDAAWANDKTFQKLAELEAAARAAEAACPMLIQPKGSGATATARSAVSLPAVGRRTGS